MKNSKDLKKWIYIPIILILIAIPAYVLDTKLSRIYNSKHSIDINFGWEGKDNIYSPMCLGSFPEDFNGGVPFIEGQSITCGNELGDEFMFKNNAAKFLNVIFWTCIFGAAILSSYKLFIERYGNKQSK